MHGVGVHGGGDAWHGACVAGDMHGKRCVAGGVYGGGMHSGGGMCGRGVWPVDLRAGDGH